MSKGKSFQLKVDLSGEHIKWFDEIKSKYSFPSNAEVIRHTIYTTIEAIEKEKNFISLDLNPLQIKHINNIIEREYIKQKYNIYNIRQFLEMAITLFKNKIIEERNSILDWDVKTSLIGKEREVAISYAKCHNKSKTKEISIDEIAIHLNWRDKQTIEDILDKFVSQSILKMDILERIKIYHI